MASDVNTNFTSMSSAREAVRLAVQEALRSAQIDGNSIILLASALVGPRFGPETFGDILPGAAYRYYSEFDVVFARAGIFDPNGVGVVAATGATAWGRRKHPPATSGHGGWGSLLGDEGSGYDLGHSALRAACKAVEGRLGLPTRLPEAIAEYFGFPVENFHNDMIRRAYHPPLTRAEIASLSPIVVNLAREGDPACMALVTRVGEDLAALALFCARQLFSAEDQFQLVVAGGMTNAGDLLLAHMREGFARAFPAVRMQIGNQDPAESLAGLARHDLLSLKESQTC